MKSKITQKMNEFFFPIDHTISQIITLKTFFLLAIFFSLVGDLSYLLFLKLQISNVSDFSKMMNEYVVFFPNLKGMFLNPIFVEKTFSTFQFVVSSFILITLISNGVAYYFFSKKKKYGIQYMFSLSVTGLLFSIPGIMEAKNHGTFWLSLMIFMIPLYFFLWRGMHAFFGPIKKVNLRK